MRLAKNFESPDVLVDGKGYVLTLPEQFKSVRKFSDLRGIKITESGRKKEEHWVRNKKEKPWLVEERAPEAKATE